MNFETKENLKVKLRELSSKLKKNKYLIIVLAAGIMLLMLPAGNDSNQEATINNELTDESSVFFDVKAQEERLESILSKVSGAGCVDVMLSLQTTSERILAEENETAESSDDAEKETSQSRKPVIISKNSSTDTAVTVKYIYPQYLGAVVVAEGGDNAAVRLALTEGVSAITGLSSNKIKVIKMKQTGGTQ